MANKKKMYGRWKLLNERALLIERCRRLTQVMGQINMVIKSVADNAFALSQDNIIKERAILQLTSVFKSGLGESFKRWREVNRIEKLKKNINQGNRKFIIKLLENLLHYNKIQQLRNIIAKFKANRQINNIQRSFLRRLLQSKAGMVVLAFKEIKSLP